ncbi:sigma-70 family RNA polymerase sigma factor [Sandaracinobacter sp. RS1-74]|uniref:RNA polymerase sigma factor n=1 Tax=Sandaracinobacteroides sayramensis TaxID=2913411 RepID=UPI001EDC5EB2|nr:sigma-70 family RNA polymerase sigma factor [Sandaracinobacteroides sayramensis]MCG2842575.1 sigma-70 family RNA polymerase sigma factor [Sandaracinobacteroides sayramensis]
MRLGTQTDGNGDQDILEDLNRHFRAPLVRYFSHNGIHKNDRDDLVQEVFLRLAHRGRLGEIDQVEGYLFTTASSVFKDWCRQAYSRALTAHVPFEAVSHEGRDHSPDQILLGREDLSRVTGALQSLPERTRFVFVLRRLEGMAYKEIATRLGISVSAVEKHMQRAIAHLLAVRWED